MMGLRLAITAALLLVLAAEARAETAWVTDRVQITLRWSPAADAPAVKTLSTGASLEVLERGAGFTRVRDAAGAEGWVANDALMAEPPARPQLDRLRGQLAAAQSALAAETARTKELAQKLAELAAGQNAPAAPQPDAAAPAPPAAAPGPAGRPFFDWTWLGISFAMLIIGFAAGVWWLRELNRRKLGGMHLRI
jgi:SH3-like domain-containing protein